MGCIGAGSLLLESLQLHIDTHSCRLIPGSQAWILLQNRLANKEKKPAQNYSLKLEMDPVSDEQTCSPTDGCLSLKLSKRRSSFEPTASVALTNERTASLTKPCFLTFGKPQKPSTRACVKRSAFRAVVLSSCCPVHMLRCETRARLHVCVLLIRCKTCNESSLREGRRSQRKINVGIVLGASVLITAPLRRPNEYHIPRGRRWEENITAS